MNRECGNGGSKKWIEINLLVRVVSVVVVVVFVVVVVVVIIVVVVVVVIVVVVNFANNKLRHNFAKASDLVEKYIEQMRSLME